MFLLFSVLFAIWCFHHSTFSAQRYDNFQERQKYTLINLLFWREWNLPLAKFISVENNKPLKDLTAVWMIGHPIRTYYLYSSLFLLFRQSFISVAGCRFKPSRWIEKVLELFTLQRRKKQLQTVYRLTFSYSKRGLATFASDKRDKGLKSIQKIIRLNIYSIG